MLNIEVHHAVVLLLFLPLVGWLVGFGIHYNRVHAARKRARMRYEALRYEALERVAQAAQQAATRRAA